MGTRVWKSILVNTQLCCRFTHPGLGFHGVYWLRVYLNFPPVLGTFKVQLDPVLGHLVQTRLSSWKAEPRGPFQPGILQICWPGHTTNEKNRIQKPDRCFWKRKSYFNYLTLVKWHWERACLSLAAVTSHPGRSMCISKTCVYSIRKKK